MTTVTDLFSQFGPNSAFIQELYQAYLADPQLVGEPWIGFFRSLENQAGGDERSHDGAPTISLEVVKKQAAVSRLIDTFRSNGHFQAKMNPLSTGIRAIPEHEELSLSAYGLSTDDLESPFFTDGLLSEGTATLSEILSKLQDAYCGSIGFEFMHLSEKAEREFLREQVESHGDYGFSTAEKKKILNDLIVAETLEGSLHKRYVGQKRFSLEGGETAIPMLGIMLDHGAKLGVKEAVIGMPHRGRLNVLINIAGKPLEKLFTEFEDRTPATKYGSGDVKYHLGYTSTYTGVNGGQVQVTLAPNPSHLEFVNPVIEGMVRAMQDFKHSKDATCVVPVLLHGEAAFSGQGIVYETLNFAGTAGYDTGGTIHLVVNNQIGFTATSDEQRGTTYCSDLAKGINAPVFHINAEDPEAACWAMKCAIEFRQKFGRDVIIDLICYRKYGHNEGDDPTFTQPLMYSEVKSKSPISKIYLSQLAQESTSNEDEYDSLQKSFIEHFEASSERSQAYTLESYTEPQYPQPAPVKTAVAKETLHTIAKALTHTPEGFVPHAKLIKLLEKRAQHVIDGSGIEWGVAEGLAFGSLMLEGVNIRLSGQDCGRGTFSHRHAVLDHSEKMENYTPLSSLGTAATLEVLNSVLSEAGVLGFEFGYSNVLPSHLVMWEGQFGDFANGAQVIIDQFIASSETKWGYRSGVVLLLPHGYEGQGPEHSSARLERYLQLCAEGNMSVCYPSNASQYFHLVRRQGLRDVKRPLIVMTPKSLLRLPEAACTTESLTNGSWMPVISETVGTAQKAKSTFVMSGKIYYDVVKALNEAGKSAHIVRVEELYPHPEKEIKEMLSKHSKTNLYWVQEEPRNMGAWSFMDGYLRDAFDVSLKYLGRPASATTAAGSGKRHAFEQKNILDSVVEAAGK